MGHRSTDMHVCVCVSSQEELLPVDGLKASVSLHSQAKGLTGALPNGMVRPLLQHVSRIHTKS